MKQPKKPLSDKLLRRLADGDAREAAEYLEHHNVMLKIDETDDMSLLLLRLSVNTNWLLKKRCDRQ